MDHSSPKTDLPTRRLGKSDLAISVVGLGCNNFGEPLDFDETAAVLEQALAAGVTFFDTADIYGEYGGSERLMGEALEGRRDELILASKFGMEMVGDRVPNHPRGSRDYIRWAVAGSLERLRTDRIDFYQYHEPDGRTPIAETLRALAELIEEGVVGAIGCSNFDAGELEQAERVAAAEGLPRFESVQNHYSLLERGIEGEVVPTCERLGISVIPYFPLENGLLTGKYKRGVAPPAGTRLAVEGSATEEQFDVVEALEAYAAARSLAPVEVAIGGLAAQPGVASVIAGATKPEQVRANVAALRWSPSSEDLIELDRIAPTPRAR